MKTTTTRTRPKPFAWSYSKLKNFESCPKKHYHVDIAKDVTEGESEQLQYGNVLHKVTAEAIEGKNPLPDHFKFMQEWVDKVTLQVTDTPNKILVEQQLALNSDFEAAEWFGKDAWYRGIADVIKIVGPVAVVLDWKTGKIKEDGVQLALMAACVFAHHPAIQKIRTEFVWIKEDAVTRADFTRADMKSVWAGVLPRVESLENASKIGEYPPRPGYLCRKWCPVEKCIHHGV